jgi:hypothetical protein
MCQLEKVVIKSEELMKSLDSCIKFNEQMFKNIDTDAGQENIAQLHRDSAFYLKELKKMKATSDRMAIDIDQIKQWWLNTYSDGLESLDEYTGEQICEIIDYFIRSHADL